MKLIQKARILELRLKVKKENKKKIKQQSYRAFLQDPPRPLPPFKTLKKFRTLFLSIAVVCLLVPCLQVIFFYNTLFYVPEIYYLQDDLEAYMWGFIRSIPMIFGMFFFILSGFAMAVDWTIHRRWGKHTIIDW